jgi:S-adenosyl methyltransferase
MATEWSRRIVAGHNEPLLFDTSVAHYTRMYNYWLGGKDNFAADREAGDRAIEAFPHIVLSVRANRAFLSRAVRFLAGEAGIRQFLDIGTGLPAANNTHEVAQEIAPGSRVVYVDNDPFVLAHARALLASEPKSSTEFLDADVRDPRAILAAAGRLLDFSRPVAVMLLAILQHLDDEDDPGAIVAALLDALPPGSYLALSHPAKDLHAEGINRMACTLTEMTGEEITLRTGPAVTKFFEGLELVEPGVVQASKWRPISEAQGASPASLWAGIGRKV